MRAALVEIESGVVVNVIVLHDEWPSPPHAHHRYVPPEGFRVVPIHAESQIGHGWRHWRGFFFRPWERHEPPSGGHNFLHPRPRKRRAVSVKLIFRPHQEGSSMSQGTLRIGQQLVCALAIADAQGNAVVPPNPAAWALAVDGVVDITVAPDSFSATFVAKAVGTTDVDVTVEGDPQPGVDTIHGHGTIQVLPAEAATVALDFGAAVNTADLKPAAAVGG